MIAPVPQKQTQIAWRDANTEFLRLSLRRLRCVLEQRVLWLRHHWSHDPRQDYAAQVISEAQIDGLLRGEDQIARENFYNSDPRVLDLKRTIVALEDEIIQWLEVMGRMPPALDVLTRLFRLSILERQILLLCLGPEMDAAFAPLYAYLQNDMSRRLPTMHLVLDVFGAEAAEGLGETSALRRYRLLHVTRPPSQAAASSALSLDERIIDYLRGVNRPDEQLAPLIRPLNAGLLTRAQIELAQRIADDLTIHRRTTGEWTPVNLVGVPDTGQSDMAYEICRCMGIQLYRLDLTLLERDHHALLEREALLLQIGFYVEADETPLPATLLNRLRGQVFFLIASREPIQSDQSLLTLPLTRPRVIQRVELWQKALGAEASDTDLSLIVDQFEFGPQTIARTAASARQQARMEGTDLSSSHVWRASRDISGGELDQLAQRIIPSSTWDDLVLPPTAFIQLEEIAVQVSHRYTVYERWGFASSRGRGISALFAGPSGTGKTMTAEVLAAHLDLALYRIDLASMISKYVGETEKHIRSVFEAAERRGAILFFDEADAMFGKRTDVKDSHDRFANIEINYLLQQMESYPGLAILATNRRAALDRAFLRRLRFVVEFVFPDFDQRRRIWEVIIPSAVPRASLDYERLARLEVAGGNIRNIAMNAAFLAAGRGEVLTMHHLMRAARREYAKIEKLETEAEFGEYYDR